MSANGKLRKTENGHAFWCFGCKEFHQLPSDQFQFSGDYNHPTIAPSVVVSSGEGLNKRVCHLFITRGKIRYLTDCWHILAGSEVAMRDEESQDVLPAQ